MNKMIDPRTCKHFRNKDVCPNANQEIMVYLDNQVISDMSITLDVEMFDKVFEFCASCAQFSPISPFLNWNQTTH